MLSRRATDTPEQTGGARMLARHDGLGRSVAGPRFWRHVPKYLGAYPGPFCCTGASRLGACQSLCGSEPRGLSYLYAYLSPPFMDKHYSRFMLLCLLRLITLQQSYERSLRHIRSRQQCQLQTGVLQHCRM